MTSETHPIYADFVPEEHAKTPGRLGMTFAPGMKPTANGAAYWSHKAIRDSVIDDTYKPHTFEEVRALVSDEVASRLDPSERYGIWWYGRRRTQTRQTSESTANGTVYRKKTLATRAPKSDWIAVPVPDSGVPREWVDAARRVLEYNPRPASASGERVWTLSGGLFVCGGCGRSMAPMTTRRPNGKRYFYYRCPKRVQDGNGACSQAAYYAAEKIEADIWDLVAALLQDPEEIRESLERMIDDERTKRVRSDKEMEMWAEKLAEVDGKRTRFQHSYAEGVISLEDLRTRLSELEDVRETAKQELEALKTHTEALKDMERDKNAILDSYVGMAPDALNSLAPKERHRVYKMLALKVSARTDSTLEVSGAFADDLYISELGIRQTRGTRRTRRTRRSSVIPTTRTIG